MSAQAHRNGLLVHRCVNCRVTQQSHIWFGYKRHESVDMRHGLINKVTVTPTNVPNQMILGSLLPRQGMVFLEGALLIARAQMRKSRRAAVTRGRYAKTITKQRTEKRDRWGSGARMPFEGVFSKQ